MKNNERTKMVLRYAAIIAKGQQASDEEKAQLVMIEDHLHLTKESILLEATNLGLAKMK